MKSIEMKIEGMHCASCEKIISSDLSELPGVSEIKINFAEGKGSLQIDESLSSIDQVKGIIKKAGYSVASVKEL